MNSRDNFAAGAALSFDYSISRSFAAGLNFTASSNFSGITVLEPSALLRLYLPGGGAGLFAQADLGAHLLAEDGKTETRFMGGLRAGYRMPLKQSFYIEPHGRVGYPFMFGFGVTAGIKTGNKKAAARQKLAEEINARLKELNVTGTRAGVTRQGVSINLSNVQFLADSAVLTDQEKKRLQEIAQILAAVPGRRIQIAGHTALTGDEDGSFALSLERAQSVAVYLVTLGARAPEEITTAGYGSSRPIADNTTPEGMAANRRVEITILDN